MLTQVLDRMIEQNPVLLAQRTADARRYIVSRWKQEHDSPINQEAVALFLCDEKQGALTEEQRIFAKEKRAEVFACYRSVVLRMFLCGEKMRLHMVSWRKPMNSRLRPLQRLRQKIRLSQRQRRPPHLNQR